DPGKTAEVVHDGWFHTGDLAWQDEDGYFWIAGRSDDCFKSRGIFIVPIEIENALMEHPAVAEACVMAAPHDRDGNLIRAVIVPRDRNAGGDALVEELRTMLKSTLARNKVPHLFEFMDELPKSAVGKVMRRALMEHKT
ncbi:MAG: AMP-binding protein, partial [Betaproteobacteria bacterium]|nr:AMP-binding protein [Betaproteobacteria bacterium]